MARIDIEHNGQWACYTTISDGWIMPFMGRAEYEAWRTEEYGRTKGELRTNPFVKSIEDAARSICMFHPDNALNVMRESGLPEDECAALIDGAWAWLGRDVDDE